jgi:hypothetical protein
MSRRYARIIVLAEDRRQWNLVRCYLREIGLVKDDRALRSVLCGQGSAEQFVRRQYPDELRSLRSRKYQLNLWLVVVIDADTHSVETRLSQLEEEVRKSGFEPLADTEPVFVLVPKRNVETWIWFLLGNPVNESDDYGRLVDDRDCRTAACQLRDIRTRNWHFPDDVPASLVRGSAELRRMEAVPHS